MEAARALLEVPAALGNTPLMKPRVPFAQIESPCTSRHRLEEALVGGHAGGRDGPEDRVAFCVGADRLAADGGEADPPRVGPPLRGRRARHRRESVSLLAPNVNTGTFNAFLQMLAQRVKPDEHVVLVMDRAGAPQPRTEAAGARDGAAAAAVLAAVQPGGEPVAPPAQPPPEQPGLRRLRRVDRRRRLRVATAHPRRHQVRLPMPVHGARATLMIRITSVVQMETGYYPSAAEDSKFRQHDLC